MAKRGRPPSWLKGNPTAELVQEFVKRADEIELQEIAPAKNAMSDLKTEAEARGLSWKPFNMARTIMTVSDDPIAVALFVDKLNFNLKNMGLQRVQFDLEHGDEVSVKVPGGKLTAVA